MKVLSLMMIAAFVAAGAQDSSFSRLALRGSVFRNPVAGHIASDWSAKTGVQIAAATNVGRGGLELAVGHIGYRPTTGKPPFTGTMFTLAWTTPEVAVSRMTLSGGVRLTDLRMDFDDPSLVGGLRTEEEVMTGLLGRARIPLGWGFAGFVDGSWDLLMLSTKTPMVFVHAGVERTMRMPGFLQTILR